MDRISWGQASDISLRPLTSLDCICRPALSLAPISMIVDTISINSHWLEHSYQVLRPVGHFKTSYLLYIVSVLVTSNLGIPLVKTLNQEIPLVMVFRGVYRCCYSVLCANVHNLSPGYSAKLVIFPMIIHILIFILRGYFVTFANLILRDLIW